MNGNKGQKQMAETKGKMKGQKGMAKRKGKKKGIKGKTRGIS